MCDGKLEDSIAFTQFKGNCKKNIQEKFVIDLFHKIATFLNPDHNDLSLLSATEIYEVHSTVADLMKKMTDSNENERDESQPPQKIGRFDLYKKKRSENVCSNEIKLYCEIARNDSNEDILQWWSKNQQVFPCLSKVARKILAIPSSSSTSERLFSIAGRIMEERRNGLDGNRLDKLIFIYANDQ